MTKIETATYAIPHGDFEKTGDGFVFSFKAESVIYFCLSTFFVFMVMMVGGVAHELGKSKTGWMHWAGMIFTLVAISLYFIIFRQPKARIIVNADTIKIGKKTYARKDFGGFFTKEITFKNSFGSKTKSYLWFNYGSSQYPVLGKWRDDEATRVSAALNIYLNATPLAGQTSPNQLRSTMHTTDF